MKNIDFIIEVAKEIKDWNFGQLVCYLQANGISGKEIGGVLQRIKSPEKLVA